MLADHGIFAAPMDTGSPRRPLYPEIEPFNSGFLKVSPLHEIYFEESGNPNGKQRRFFDPSKYRIVLFDQRGCGKSKPHASLEDNTTWHLVADMERVREHLKIDRWQVFGGSWGSTLALAYAEKYPARVTELVLRGIFLLRKSEIDWFYQAGASALYADAWEDYLAPIPEAERGDLLHAYHRRLTSEDPKVRQEAARAWSVWEGRTSCLAPNEDLMARTGGDEFSLAFARIECHYFVNAGFLQPETLLLDDVAKIRHIPAVIVQGRYDVVCPMENAWALHRAWPEADLRIVGDAGHSAFEPGILSELVDATDRFAALTS
jgi:proline iminopeptidase